MISDCRLVNIRSFEDKRGGLSVIEGQDDIPFDILRIYYLYKTSNKLVRGVHAHKRLEQFIIAFKGKFEILLDDGKSQKTFILDNPTSGLYVCPEIWREVYPIDDDGVCAVLASRKYEPEDYIHEYSEFIKYLNQK